MERYWRASCQLIQLETQLSSDLLEQIEGKEPQLIVLYKDGKTVQISGLELRYVPASRLCAGVFDATDYHLESLRAWHGAEIFVRVEPEQEPKLGGPRDKAARANEAEATRHIKSLGTKVDDPRSKDKIRVEVQEKFGSVAKHLSAHGALVLMPHAGVKALQKNRMGRVF